MRGGALTPEQRAALLYGGNGDPYHGHTADLVAPSTDRRYLDDRAYYLAEGDMRIRRARAVMKPLPLVTSFAGWTANFTAPGSVDLAAAGGYDGAATCASLTTGGHGSSDVSYITWNNGADPWDLTHAYPVLALKIDNSNNLHSAGISLYAGSDSSGFTNYWQWSWSSGASAVSRYYTPDGEWLLVPFDFAMSPTVNGSPVRTAVKQWRVKVTDIGGTVPNSPVTVKVGMLALARDAMATYPGGLASITFDDGRDGQFNWAYPILRSYGIAGTAYIVRQSLGVGGYMTAANLVELHEAGWDIGPHADTTAAHTNRYASMSGAAAAADVQACRTYLQSIGIPNPDHFCWPGGEYTADNWTAVKALGVKSMRTTFASNTGTYVEQYPSASPFRLRAASSSGVASSLVYMQNQIQKAHDNRAWAILAFHQMGSAPTDSNSFNYKEFETLINFALDLGVAFRSIGQLIP
jgi:peptidoglycan/xylan/chitin deacetylase (PgdA/CDA1 family)